MAAPHAILYSKPGCCLCDDAKEILERLRTAGELEYDVVDITENPAAYDRYRYGIPVLEIAGGETFMTKITEYQIRKALSRLP